LITLLGKIDISRIFKVPGNVTINKTKQNNSVVELVEVEAKKSSGWIKPSKTKMPRIPIASRPSTKSNKNKNKSPWTLSVTRTIKSDLAAQKKLKQTTLFETMKARRRPPNPIVLPTLSVNGGGGKKINSDTKSQHPQVTSIKQPSATVTGLTRKSADVEVDEGNFEPIQDTFRNSDKSGGYYETRQSKGPNNEDMKEKIGINHQKYRTGQKMIANYER